MGAIPRIAGRSGSVLVIGEALVERRADGDCVGGAAFNVARLLAALGVSTTLVTRIGADDDDGARVLASALRFGLDDCSIQRDARRATGAAWQHIDVAQARALAARRLPDIVCFSALAHCHPATSAALRAVRIACGALHFLNLRLHRGLDMRAGAAAALERAHWVLVDEDDLRRLLVWFVPRRDAASPADSIEHGLAIRELMARFTIERLLVHGGEQGARGYDRRARCVVKADPTMRSSAAGAADAHCAALLAQLLQRRALAGALALSERFARAIVGDRGTLPDVPAPCRAWCAALGLQRRAVPSDA